MTPLTEEQKQEIITEVLAARANRKQFLLEMKQRQQAGLKIAQKCASLLKRSMESRKLFYLVHC